MFARSVLLQGNLKPEDATNALKMFEGKFQRLKEERDNVVKAKEALELAEPGLSSACLLLFVLQFQPDSFVVSRRQ